MVLDENLIGFASYFAKQIDEEHGHAAKIANHLVDRDLRPELDAAQADFQVAP